MGKIILLYKQRLKHATHVAVMRQFSELADALEINHPKAAGLKAAMSKAVEAESLTLKKQMGSDITALINDADTKRDNAYKTIKAVTQAFANGTTGDQAMAAKHLKKVLDRYEVEVRAQLDEETGLMTALINTIEESYVNDITALGLQDTYIAMVQGNKAVKELLLSRSIDRAPVQIGEMKANRAATDQAYEDMVMLIDSMMFLYPTADLVRFVEVWNDVANRIRVQVLRASSADGTVDVDLDAEIEPGTPTPEDDDLSQE